MYRILALTDFQCDFLSHSLLVGLHETGHEIWELPVLNSIRGGVDRDYILPDGNRGYSGTPSYLLNNPIPRYEREELSVSVLKDMDLIIMLSGRDYARRAFNQVTELNGGKKPDNIVLCCGEDFDWIDRDLINEVNPKVFFKRELSTRYSLASYSGAYGRPVFPLPFAAFTRGYPKQLSTADSSENVAFVGKEIDDSIKNFDFYVSLGDTHQLRRDLIRTLLDERDRNQKFRNLTTWIACNSEDPTIKGRAEALTGWNEYITKQAQSRITVSIRGYGMDALHAWEAFSFATLVLYFAPEIYIPYPFKDKLHCVLLKEDEIHHAPGLIRLYSEAPNTQFRTSVALGGKRHCRQFHSTKARAQYLLDISMRVISGETPKYEEFGL